MAEVIDCPFMDTPGFWPVPHATPDIPPVPQATPKIPPVPQATPKLPHAHQDTPGLHCTRSEGHSPLVEPTLQDQYKKKMKRSTVCTQHAAEKVSTPLNQLSIRATAVYQEICNQLTTDEAIIAFRTRIDTLRPALGIRCSGRTFDTLVTSAAKYLNCSYFLDITDPSNIVYVPNGTLLREGRHIIHFNIQMSYRQKMQQYSKKYFDCFARGAVVQHRLDSGGVIDISICQYMFFLWVFENRIDEFLSRNFESIVEIRRMNQYKNYTPKKKQRAAYLVLPRTSAKILAYPNYRDRAPHRIVPVRLIKPTTRCMPY